MICRVIDTNVPVAANGRNTHASPDCRLKAARFLRRMLQEGRTILDLAGEIQAEYRRYLNTDGQPGVGDQFFRMILMSAPDRVTRIDLPQDPDTGTYADFPADPALATFDPSDRKFAAAARQTGHPVSAVDDRGWWNHREALSSNGILIELLCDRPASSRTAP
ncbi:MAG: PIN domain-containing protein [Gammaproteobacteria bacterium]|jgi:hypothetical protein|nr:PIN domain-containing protein [Gammaproteobacteria bacterium]